jgi:hypothetical protein
MFSSVLTTFRVGGSCNGVRREFWLLVGPAISVSPLLPTYPAILVAVANIRWMISLAPLQSPRSPLFLFGLVWRWLFVLSAMYFRRLIPANVNIFGSLLYGWINCTPRFGRQLLLGSIVP